ncbi:MAG TPA: glycosyltransferase [Mariniphaga anaerophila]|uniref:Glycosyltransferase n=1 Tax=Mariniphaga anaerophila TaxID=1484053 RepID=A0A831LTC3_9BACT|nr:glycosyltransferase [Mariniphaga anaerophila]
MKISIITATYNSAAHMAAYLASVNNQSYENIEHIIVDGASTDNTQEIIKTTANRVTQLISEPDHGIYDALNKGLRHATGDVIGFLHADIYAPVSNSFAQ